MKIYPWYESKTTTRGSAAPMRYAIQVTWTVYVLPHEVGQNRSVLLRTVCNCATADEEDVRGVLHLDGTSDYLEVVRVEQGEDVLRAAMDTVTMRETMLLRRYPK